MTMINRAIGAGILHALAPFSNAADPDVEKLLARMRQVYSTTNTAKITVRTTGLRFGKSQITSEIIYMKERKIRAKISSSGSAVGRTRLFISDGEKYSADDLSGNVQHGKFDLDSIPIPINLEAMSFWDWKRQLSTSPGANMELSKFKLESGVKWYGKEWIVLSETAHGQNVYVDYFVDPKTALIYRVQVYDLQKKQLRVETVVMNLDRNISVDPALFKIKAKTTDGGKAKIRF